MEVSYDKYSLMVDGKRVFIKSGAFHYFRTPGEEMARDRFMKMKAGGYNTVDIYFNWNYHSPRQGEYDFSGIKDKAMSTLQGEKTIKTIDFLKEKEVKVNGEVCLLRGKKLKEGDTFSFENETLMTSPFLIKKPAF